MWRSCSDFPETLIPFHDPFFVLNNFCSCTFCVHITIFFCLLKVSFKFHVASFKFLWLSSQFPMCFPFFRIQCSFVCHSYAFLFCWLFLWRWFYNFCIILSYFMFHALPFHTFDAPLRFPFNVLHFLLVFPFILVDSH
jgi:hypothetical protein